MARVLVTGGSGFIGTNLVSSFLQDGWEVQNFDLALPRNPNHQSVYLQGDIRDAGALTAAFRNFRPELVVHFAARTDLEGNSVADYSSNTNGVQNVIDAIKACDTVTRAMFASSRYVHRTEIFPLHEDDYSPFTSYGESKVETERIVRVSGLEIPWLLVRPTSIWGPWFSIPYRTFFDTVRKGVYVHPSGVRIRKSYGYVGNVVHQIRKFLSVAPEKIDRRTFYLSDEAGLEVLEFAQLIREAFGAPRVRQVPMSVMELLAHAGDLLKRMGMPNPPLTSFRLNNLLTPMDYDISATCEVAGSSPYSLKEGVRLTVDWMLQHE